MLRTRRMDMVIVDVWHCINSHKSTAAALIQPSGSDFKLVLKWFAIFQFDIDLAAPECLPFVEGWVTFERKWWVKVSIPFIGGFFVTVAFRFRSTFL